ncbi:hypothetical protein ACIRSS_23105 [Amycolatopsis sp. NPDC101161]|uniref:hypothetical protein n=1 Tax=Amycolatopsis sp. NPDC101161 TaxID=3363940 RepID=UPI003827738E
MNVAWWALGVSALSLFVAASSLLWNVYSFRRTGPIVRVEFSMVTGVELFEGVEDDSRYPWELTRSLWDSGRTYRRFIKFRIDVRNIGRSPIDIDSVSVGYLPHFDLFETYVYRPGTESSIRLDHGSRRVFEQEFRDLVGVQAHEIGKRAQRIYARVSLGDGVTLEPSVIPYSKLLDAISEAEKEAAAGGPE